MFDVVASAILAIGEVIKCALTGRPIQVYETAGASGRQW